MKSGSQATPENFDPSLTFLNILNAKREQIISVNDVPAKRIPKNTLVRFRCMIQDTGLGQEMLVSAYETKTETGESRLECYRYTDDPIQFSDSHVPEQYLSERALVYCVSPPGENTWVKEAYNVYKGTLEDQLNQLDIDSKIPQNNKKYPLASDHTSAIVKFYNGMDESVRVGQLVEVIGIRGQDFEQESTEDFGLESPLKGMDHTPVLHAIAFKDLNQHTPLEQPGSANVRSQVIGYLASVLGEDLIAAEFVLLQLLARVTTKINSLKIGHLTLNLNGFPSFESKETMSPVVKPLLEVLENLTVHTVRLPLTIQNLNQSRFVPKCVAESLESGLLQLVEGTVLLADETVLGEGQLKDTGVHNFQALQSLIQNQTLGYEYPYNRYDFDTDLSVLSVSSNKSILPNHCFVPLVPMVPLEDSAENKLKLTKETLDEYRRYLHSCKFASYEIPDQVAEYIQDSFVNERKKATESKDELPTQEDLMLRMSLARLAAVSFGENSLSNERYDYVVNLDKQRKSRIEQASKK